MLRNKLLTTTFLMIVGSVSFSSAQSAGISGDQSGGIAMTAAGTADNRATTFQMPAEFGNPGKDRNREFLCTYGYSVHDSDYDSGNGSGFEHWVHYAVPIRGKGASVSQIQVTDSESSSSYSPKFKVGIYENKNGKPGKLIAGGTGKAKGLCRLTTVVIPKTFLAAGKKYWIEENALDPDDGKHGHCCGYYAVSWGFRQNAKHNAYYQYYSSISGAYSSLSDWLPVSGSAPFARVR
jgi:hypothetical protein